MISYTVDFSPPNELSYICPVNCIYRTDGLDMAMDRTVRTYARHRTFDLLSAASYPLSHPGYLNILSNTFIHKSVTYYLVCLTKLFCVFCLASKVCCVLRKRPKLHVREQSPSIYLKHTKSLVLKWQVVVSMSADNLQII